MMQTFRINLKTNVGALSNKKVDALVAALKPFFPSMAFNLNGEMLLMVDDATKTVILLTGEQITFGQDEFTSPLDFDKIQKVINCVYDTLLLDSDTVVGVQLIGCFDHGSSTMDPSLTKLAIPSADLKGQLKGLSGVGYRFLIDHGEDVWELKVEPFLRDQNKWFMEALCGTSKPSDIASVAKISSEAYTCFKGEWAAFVTRYFLKGDLCGERREKI